MVEGSLSGCSGVLFWAGCCSWFVISVVLVGVSSPVCCCSFGERRLNLCHLFFRRLALQEW